MTNVEALKKLYQQVGGDPSTLDGNTNLELLNAITEALGGEPDATENAKGIDNVAAVASGGGGVAWKTVPVTFRIQNNSSKSTGTIVTLGYWTLDDNSELDYLESPVDATETERVANVAVPDLEFFNVTVETAGVEDVTQVYNLLNANSVAAWTVGELRTVHAAIVRYAEAIQTGYGCTLAVSDATIT